MCVCMCVFVRCVYVCVYLPECVYVCVCLSVCVCICVYACVYLPECVYVCVCFCCSFSLSYFVFPVSLSLVKTPAIFFHTHTHIHTLTYIHTYIDAHTETCTHYECHFRSLHICTYRVITGTFSLCTEDQGFPDVTMYAVCAYLRVCV
ncbi:hypothetical protein ANANG_G00028900 [Anguilla anguilla]|uniref:Uncharacterized protein n=1 Tax=Anguilla anguilla TaxID=7936 RepID=A0A9D3MRM4_ANGAN|nr:hypothetical protein ANANG_G00028900 [Anguilla anguilla]